MISKRTTNSLMSNRSSDFEKECQNHLNWMESLLEETQTKPEVPAQPVKPTPKAHPKVIPKQEKPEIQYRISDIPVYDSSDEEESYSDCEDYYVEDAEEIHGKAIPNWARAANLINELQAQVDTDPDTIFVGFTNTCDLSQMFNKKKASFKIRGDSGMWIADNLTPEEVEKYKQAVGYA